jgi:hypothetical protein
VSILFNDTDGSPAYKLVKLECGYELMRWSEGGEEITRGRYIGNTTKSGWKKMAAGNGLFPTDIRYAIQLIADDQLSAGTNSVDLKTELREVSKYMRELDAVAEVAAVLVQQEV